MTSFMLHRVVLPERPRYSALTMPKLKPLILFAALACSVNAFALDSSANVKITPLLKTTKNWGGKPIVYPKGQAEITGMIVEIAPGGESGWHKHPVPSFGVLLEGTLEVKQKNGETKILQAGEAVAEVVDTLHNGRNIGNIPAKLVVFYTGAVGKALTIKAPDLESEKK